MKPPFDELFMKKKFKAVQYGAKFRILVRISSPQQTLINFGIILVHWVRIEYGFLLLLATSHLFVAIFKASQPLQLLENF